MLDWLRRRLAKLDPPRIEIEADGFAVVGSGGERRPIRWDSITKISAFKRDLLTTDEIILVVEVERQGMVQELSEEWTGFNDLFAPMAERLGISPGWYIDVMSPAFDPKYRVVYERTRVS
jgi:hypothetical protein